MISRNEAADFLREADNILILSHQYPDGDTLGSATALCRGLHKMGKHAKIRCSDMIVPKYQYLFSGVEIQEFVPSVIVAVDIADLQLIGEPNQSLYGDKIDLCIDHHPSNADYAKRSCVDAKAAATCEIIFDLLNLLDVEIDTFIADCLYTGITTDTGCFKYINVTPTTYRIAADLVEKGADGHKINRVMFDTKSRARIDIERCVMDSIRYFYDNRVAVIKITNEMIRSTGATEGDIEGLASIPRAIEGVIIGVTIREKSDGGFKISLRAQPPQNASKICSAFGGGGHAGAAGCTFNTTVEEAERLILAEIGKHI
nr:bifunctional oligoribonuclease/PAP phosphatase NrnA [uncultured Caproiciproducens sp.]